MPRENIHTAIIGCFLRRPALKSPEVVQLLAGRYTLKEVLDGLSELVREDQLKLDGKVYSLPRELN